MDGPDHRLPALLQVLEKQRIVEEITVDIVDVDHIRVDFADTADERLGRAF